MLFSYGLGTHVQGKTMEVRGFVPSEAIRDRALQVAAEATGLVVGYRLGELGLRRSRFVSPAGGTDQDEGGSKGEKRRRCHRGRRRARIEAQSSIIDKTRTGAARRQRPG